MHKKLFVSFTTGWLFIGPYNLLSYTGVSEFFSLYNDQKEGFSDFSLANSDCLLLLTAFSEITIDYSGPSTFRDILHVQSYPVEAAFFSLLNNLKAIMTSWDFSFWQKEVSLIL